MWRITGYSVVMPLPPCISRASRAPSSATRTLLRLAMLTCANVISPASLSWPRRRAISSPSECCVASVVSFCCTSWRAAIGRPNVSRVLV